MGAQACSHAHERTPKHVQVAQSKQSGSRKGSTSPPTELPSTAPTEAPSAQPTQSPSEHPSNRPTQACARASVCRHSHAHPPQPRSSAAMVSRKKWGKLQPCLLHSKSCSDRGSRSSGLDVAYSIVVRSPMCWRREFNSGRSSHPDLLKTSHPSHH